MFEVIYDPINGQPFRDGTVLEEALTIYKDRSKKYPNWSNVTVSTSNFVEAIRLLCHRELIPWDKVRFEYKGEIIEMDKDCKLKSWPDGFCDFNEKCLFELL